MPFLLLITFLLSLGVLFWSGGFLVNALRKMAQILNWREFVVAFFIMAFCASLPNLFVGISSALHKVPQLSFGEIVGGNVIDLTLGIAIAALIAGGLEAKSKLVQRSAVFTFFFALLPLFLIFDKNLSRGDGLVLIFAFFLYVFWLFKKEDRFTKIYDKSSLSPFQNLKLFFKTLGELLFGILALLAASEGVVRSSILISEKINWNISLIGILLVGIGNTLPEIYFACVSAKEKENWMVLGDLMGSIVLPSSLILGIVSLISPIKLVEITSFAIARIFLIISAIFFLWIVKTGQKITKKEAFSLIGLYLLFVFLVIIGK